MAAVDSQDLLHGDGDNRPEERLAPSLCAPGPSPWAQIALALLCQKWTGGYPKLDSFIHPLSCSEKHLKEHLFHIGAGSLECGIRYAVSLGACSLASSSLSFPICEMGTTEALLQDVSNLQHKR